MRIGNVDISSNVFFAPLAGFSDIGMRSLCYKYGAGLCYTEMVSIKGLEYDNERTKELLTISNIEKPIAVQLFGNDPNVMCKAVQLECVQKFDIIDINMGCPVRKIVANNDGSALLNNPSLAIELVMAAKTSNKPVTVKMRLGIDNAENATCFAVAMEKAGADAITVHGRTAKQMYSGKANWAPIADIKTACKVPIICNGDIIDCTSMNNAISITGCDGVMIGRGAIGKPEIFAELNHKKVQINTANDIMYHVDKLLGLYPERIVVNLMKKQLYFYAAKHTVNKSVKLFINDMKTLEDIKYIAENYFNYQ